MPKHNAENERIKHRYLVWMRDAKGYSDDTIDQSLAAINRFEAHTGLKPFRLFHIEQARAFTRDLQKSSDAKTGRLYARATISGMLAALRNFVEWLAGQPEGRRRISFGDADYFRLSRKDERVARTTRTKRVPCIEEVITVLRNMPVTTEIERRDQALIAFTLLTCARVSALMTARLKHIDLDRGVFHQDAREVRTKRAKTFDTIFFPVGDEALQTIENWIKFLNIEKRFGPDDPLFPKPHLILGSHQRFAVDGLSREPYASSEPLRAIFKRAFQANDLPAPNPHVFRDTIAQLGQRLCKTPEQMKAWSQNMGHEKVLTTLTSYGTVQPDRQAALIKSLAAISPSIDLSGEPSSEHIAWVTQHLAKIHT